MESQPQNPEFRNYPENFHLRCYDEVSYKRTVLYLHYMNF